MNKIIFLFLVGMLVLLMSLFGGNEGSTKRIPRKRIKHSRVSQPPKPVPPSRSMPNPPPKPNPPARR